ncbi:ead/Ea22-like family protein [Glutamicibacter sp.]|uniref:ead/Ea22-like family protein n=1 Tax=Glutamicibacter sp. TaxID=1931995 RepID=UPI0028BE4EA8|nr:ead/Ea22-like family protein [Glutamicibacter sp.]
MSEQSLDLEQLRKIAEAEETREWGPWAFEEDDWDGYGVYINDGDNFGRSYVAEKMTQGESEGASTAEFIAMFDPTTVLALLSRLEQAEQQVARVRALCMTTDGDYIDNDAECNTVGDILEALDGEQ